MTPEEELDYCLLSDQVNYLKNVTPEIIKCSMDEYFKQYPWISMETAKKSFNYSFQSAKNLFNENINYFKEPFLSLAQEGMTEVERILVIINEL